MKYYIETTPSSEGSYELHSEFCGHLPQLHRLYIGDFSKCEEALSRSEKLYKKVCKCKFCCKS